MPDTITVSGFGATYGMTLSSKNVNIGTAKIGLAKDTVISITNTGTDNLVISGISSDNHSFTAKPSSLTIGVGGTAKDTIRFTPNASGFVEGKIFVFSNAPSSPDTILVLGNSPAPTIVSLKNFITYGNVGEGTTKNDTVKIVNSSINTLTIDSIYTKTSAFNVDRISATVGTDTLKLVISFKPTAFVSYTDTLYLCNNSATELV